MLGDHRGLSQPWPPYPIPYISKSIVRNSVIFRWFYGTQLLLVRSSDNDLGLVLGAIQQLRVQNFAIF